MAITSALDIDRRYSIDTTGNVYGPKGMLKPWKACKGKYLQVSIGGRKHYVHRLVAETFIPNPENKPDVAHIDNDGLHNHVTNLRWSTESENMADKICHGTHIQGEKHGNAKLRDIQVHNIRWLRSLGVPASKLARQYGVSIWTIYDAANPRRRKLAYYGSDT